MDCVCYNVLNNLQRQINSLFITAANNRLNSDSSTTDDGAYRPNLNLVEHGNQNTFFDLNTIFYISIILITFFSFASLMNSRRRRLGGNGSSLNWIIEKIWSNDINSII